MIVQNHPTAPRSRVQARVVRPLSPAFAPLFVPLAPVDVAHSVHVPTHSCRVVRPVRLAPAPALPHSSPAAALSPSAQLVRWPAPSQLGASLHRTPPAPLLACVDSCACVCPAARLLPPSAHSKARPAPLPLLLLPGHPKSSRLV